MTNHKIAISTCLSLFTMLTLVSCSSSKDASKENFTKAINKDILHSRKCLKYSYPLKFESDQRDVKDFGNLTQDDLNMNLALEKVGLLKSTNFDYTPRFSWANARTDEAEYIKSGSPKYTGKEFSITETGKQYQIIDKLPMICYTGGREVTEIIEFTEPVESNGAKVATVRYKYKNINTPNWIQDESIAAELAKYKKTNLILFDDVLLDKTEMILTNEGWK